MPNPWIDGPRELIQHASDHLNLGGDFDKRIAMISIDNAIELVIKTYLGLPERARGTKGPSRKELEVASESFPELLNLLQTYFADKIVDFSLDDVEWFHRLRNQLYHSGNGITVDQSKVETYLQISVSVFENLFGCTLVLDRQMNVRTKTGHFLELWNKFDSEFRKMLPPKNTYAYYWKREYLEKIDPALKDIYTALYMFRNSLVHSLDTPEAKTIDNYIGMLDELMKGLKIS